MSMPGAQEFVTRAKAPSWRGRGMAGEIVTPGRVPGEKDPVLAGARATGKGRVSARPGRAGVMVGEMGQRSLSRRP
jgi:hypothetical protein